MKSLYILKLKNNKWYIGTSENVENRIDQHFKGNGSKWTQKHTPVQLITKYKIKDLHDEDKITIQYMEKYGINNVRGGSFCSINLSDGEKEVLRKMIKTQNNKCFTCGNIGHFSKDCTNEWIDISDIESEYESESDLIIKNNNIKCFRCNRKGHMKNDCYAKSDVYGNKLYDDSEDNSEYDSEDDSEDYSEELIINNNIKCYRCHRKGHMKNDCYAKSDVYGNKL